MNRVSILIVFIIVIFTIGLVSAAGIDGAPTDQTIVITPTPTACVPYFSPDIDCCLLHITCLPPCHFPYDQPACIVITVTPLSGSQYPIPPLPEGADGGFLQVVRGDAFYTSLEYQLTNASEQLTLQKSDGVKVVIPHDVLNDLPETLTENTQIFSSDNGVALYALTTGEFQINIGPDAEGNVRVIIFDGLDADFVYGYSFNLKEIANP